MRGYKGVGSSGCSHLPIKEAFAKRWRDMGEGPLLDYVGGKIEVVAEDLNVCRAGEGGGGG